MNSMNDTDNRIIKQLGEEHVSAEEALKTAKEYLCPYGFGMNCGRCIGCELADAGEHPDIFLCGDPEHFPVKDGNLIEDKAALPCENGFGKGQVLIKEDEEKPNGFTVWVCPE